MQNQAKTYSLTNQATRALDNTSAFGQSSNIVPNTFLELQPAQISLVSQLLFLDEMKSAANKLSLFGNKRNPNYNSSDETEGFQVNDLDLDYKLTDSSKDIENKDIKSKNLFTEDSEPKFQESLQGQDFINSLNLSFQSISQNSTDTNSLLEESSERFNMSEILKLQNLRESFINGNSDPIINLDKEKLSLSIDFPSLKDLKSVSVQYDPSSRSVIANIVSSDEVAKLLQSQVSELEKNLAKHKIKLESLQVNSLKGGFTNQDQSQGNNQSRHEA